MCKFTDRKLVVKNKIALLRRVEGNVLHFLLHFSRNINLFFPKYRYFFTWEDERQHLRKCRDENIYCTYFTSENRWERILYFMTGIKIILQRRKVGQAYVKPDLFSIVICTWYNICMYSRYNKAPGKVRFFFAAGVS